MAAGVIFAPGTAALVERPVPVPSDGEVLVRLEGCGVCSSSLPTWEGRPWFDYPLEPGAPGHEGWGVEVETDRRVALFSEHAFAEYEAVPAEALVALPPELDEMPFPGEALGCALNIFGRSGIHEGQTVAIVGAGFLGLLLVQLCVDAGAHTFAIARRESTQKLAASFGAHIGIPDDESCDVVVEAAGAQQTLDLAGRLCRVRGRLVIAGYHQDGTRTVDMQLWNWRGLDVVNAHERERSRYVEGIRAAVNAVVSGRIDPRPLYTHVFPLSRLSDAFEAARRRSDGFVKALVVAE